MTAEQRLTVVKNKLTLYLSNINTSLVAKGASAVSDIGEVSSAIDTISTGVTPTGTINITRNGNYNVTDYASASVDVPSELVKWFNNELVNVEITEPIYMYNHQSAFFQQANLETVKIHNASGMVPNQTFAACPKLKVVDINGTSSRFNDYAFVRSTTFDTLILRANHVWSMAATTTFQSTPFRNGTGGTVYVPIDLVSQYEIATNWSALESTTFASIQENLVTLISLGVDITDYYEIVTALPTSNIDVSKVYFIETATAGTYEQWLYNGSTWIQLANITLGV